MRFKLFLLSFFVSAVFCWGINVLALELEDFFFWSEVADNSSLLLAQAKQAELEVQLIKLKNLRRAQERETTELDAETAITAKAVLSVRYGTGQNGQREKKILLQKNIRQILPIASLSKLMTGLVVLENLPLNQEIEISAEAIAQEEDIGGFRAGERFSAEQLLYSALIESSNDAAFALSQAAGQESFMALMNSTAEKLGLNNTYFVNPTGLDPEDNGARGNYSTAEDLANLTIYLIENHFSVWDILSKPRMETTLLDGRVHHIAKSTNALLGKIPNLLGGKTGYTEKAGGCFILALKEPATGDYLLNVILGSDDRFGEMEKLIRWIDEYKISNQSR